MRDALVEGIVVADDDLMARYLDGEEVSADELSKTLARGVVSSQVFPVICGSATKLVGIDRLLDTICDVAPPPSSARRPRAARRRRGTDDRRGACDPAGRPWLGCSRPIADPYVGRISLFKVALRHDAPRRGAVQPEVEGRRAPPRSFQPAGQGTDAVARGGGRRHRRRGQIGGHKYGRHLAPRNSPSLRPQPGTGPTGSGRLARCVGLPVLSMAIRPKSKADEDKLMTALHRLQEEDPTLLVRRDDETHQTVLSGHGRDPPRHRHGEAVAQVRRGRGAARTR